MSVRDEFVTHETPYSGTFCLHFRSEVSAPDNVMCHPITDFVLSEPEPALEPDDGEDVVEYFLNFHFAFPMPSVTEKPTINGVQHMNTVASPMVGFTWCVSVNHPMHSSFSV